MARFKVGDRVSFAAMPGTVVELPNEKNCLSDGFVVVKWDHLSRNSDEIESELNFAWKTWREAADEDKSILHPARIEDQKTFAVSVSITVYGWIPVKALNLEQAEKIAEKMEAFGMGEHELCDVERYFEVFEVEERK